MGGANPVVTAIARSFKNMGIAAISAYAVISGGKALIESGKRLDSLRASMLAASGDAVTAKKDFEFVRQSAKNLGTDLFTSAKGFQQIGTSMRAAGFDGAGIKDVFLAASEASVAFGLSADDTAGVMKAFSQIASKGKVSAEELRQQLGDRLFGAFQQAAMAMGVTTGELDKMLVSGTLMSDDFLPKMAKQLRMTVRETGALAAGMKSLNAEQARLGTSKTEFAEGLLDAGGKSTLKDLMGVVTDFIDMAKPFATSIMRVVAPIVDIFSGIVKFATLIVKPMGTILDKMLGTLGSAEGAADSMAKWKDSVLEGNEALTSVNKNYSSMTRWMFGLKSLWHGVLGLLYEFNEELESKNSLISGYLTNGLWGIYKAATSDDSKTKNVTNNLTVNATGTSDEMLDQIVPKLQEVLQTAD